MGDGAPRFCRDVSDSIGRERERERIPQREKATDKVYIHDSARAQARREEEGKARQGPATMCIHHHSIAPDDNNQHKKKKTNEFRGKNEKAISPVALMLLSFHPFFTPVLLTPRPHQHHSFPSFFLLFGVSSLAPLYLPLPQNYAPRVSLLMGSQGSSPPHLPSLPFPPPPAPPVHVCRPPPWRHQSSALFVLSLSLARLISLSDGGTRCY